ncbi:cysteine-rich and transmembrane domain-containing protein 1 isoform X2 [Struthio camelus]|uniref:cysteine-rich and transmembrane domain-containing protein 1 isoform X2 n=1 Tax=Struthio camelus TaxID=8801 RepID=UPI003603E5C7
MHNNQVVLQAHTQVIHLGLLDLISQVNQAIKVIRSMDGKMHLHLQDQSMQMGLKTQELIMNHSFRLKNKPTSKKEETDNC